MKIVIIGNESQQAETRQKFGATHDYASFAQHSDAELEDAEVVFDFLISSAHTVSKIYDSYPSLIIFADVSFIRRTQLKSRAGKFVLIGFCGMPTFVNREIIEVTTDEADVKTLKSVCARLNTDYRIVSDTVGLVTPRIICMIINEAYYTVEEGTATREDIDKAMKLGTNYPFGPFEWSKRIGVDNVCRLLDSVLEETKNNRYRVCTLLRQENS